MAPHAMAAHIGGWAWWQWGLVGAAGFVAGVLNAVAGGGSLVSMPVLVAAGLPATVANATNNTGTTVQALVALWAYRKRGLGSVRLVAWLAPLAAVAAAAGASIVLVIEDRLFARVVGVLMLVAAAWAMGGRRRSQPSTARDDSRVAPSNPLPRRPPLAAVLAALALGVYGGFFGGGVGLLLLPALAATLHTDFLHANAIKAGVNAAMNATAFAVFAAGGLIAWGPALVVVAGMVAGTHIGVAVAVERGAGWVRRAVAILAAIAATYFLVGYP